MLIILKMAVLLFLFKARDTTPTVRSLEDDDAVQGTLSGDDDLSSYCTIKADDFGHDQSLDDASTDTRALFFSSQTYYSAQPAQGIYNVL